MHTILDRPVAPLFASRFEPLSTSLMGARLSEVAQYLRTENDFVALQAPTNSFLARIFWNTVLVPVISAYSDAVARERELVEIQDRMTSIRNEIEKARTVNNTTAETILQYARDYDRWALQVDTRRSALNHAVSRLNALMQVTTNENTIQHVSNTI